MATCLASLELTFLPSESWGKTPPFCECVMVKGHVHIKSLHLADTQKGFLLFF